MTACDDRRQLKHRLAIQTVFLLKAAQCLRPHLRVLLDLIVFFGGQFSWLFQQQIGDGNFADVVQANSLGKLARIYA